MYIYIYVCVYIYMCIHIKIHYANIPAHSHSGPMTCEPFLATFMHIFHIHIATLTYISHKNT